MRQRTATTSKGSRVLDNIVSPYGLALFSYAFFWLACLIPPSTYRHYIMEPDLIFLDPATILFYTACVAAFLAGVWLFAKIFPSSPAIEHRKVAVINSTTFLLIPLLLGIAFSILSSVLLVKKNPLVLPILLAQQGHLLQVDNGGGIELEGTLNIAVLFFTGVIWWAAWRYHQLDIRKPSRRLVRLVLAFALFAEFVSSSLNLIRHPFTVVISGLVILYVLRKLFTDQMSWKLIAGTSIVFLGGGALFFFLVEMLRGGSIDDLTAVFVGYTIAPYNRLAALLQGRMHLEYSGRGIYFSNFLTFNHTFNRIIPIARIMNFPEYFDWWQSVFASVGRAGLNDRLIFFGTFGEIYAEIGWFAPAYVFGYGLLYGLIWRCMRRGNLIGILLYPYCAYCILFWFSTNNLFDQDIVALIIDVLLLSAYEFLFARKANALILIPQSD